jgi:hypothetical protein
MKFHIQNIIFIYLIWCLHPSTTLKLLNLFRHQVNVPLKLAGCSLSHSSCKTTLISGRIDGGLGYRLMLCFKNFHILYGIETGEDKAAGVTIFQEVTFIRHNYFFCRMNRCLILYIQFLFFIYLLFHPITLVAQYAVESQ